MADGYEDGAVTPPQLYRGISTIMNFSMALTAVNCVSSLITVFALGLTTGGPVVMVWGWIVVAVGFSLVGVSLAEICSAYPAAGGVYHWTAQLAPSKWAPAASYACGWANYLAGTGATATFACSFASLVSALTAAVRAPPGAFDLAPGAPGLAMATPPLPPADYTGFSPGAEVALAIAATAVWGLINALRVDQQGWVNNFAAGWQIASTAVIAAVVLGAAPELSSPTFVFTEFYNGTGWASVPYVVLIGLLYALFAFTGFDAGCQLAEETQDPSRAAPLGMIGCCLCTAVLGLILTVSLLFGTVDVAALLNNPYVGVDAANQPVVALFYYVGGRAGGPILVVLMVVNLFMAGVSTVTATSRMAFALARDDGLPGSSYLRWLHPTTGTPLLAVLLIIGVDAVILLLTLSSTSAIYNVSSLTVSCYQISYIIPVVLRLADRGPPFQPGKFALGRAARPIGWVSAVFLLLTCLILFWPPAGPVTAANMNYTIVVIAAAACISGLWWLVSARHHFVGPVTEYEALVNPASAEAFGPPEPSTIN